MRKYLVELTGTFFLVLLIVLCANNGTGEFTALAVGLGLMGLIYAGGHVSMAHYNPAVTIAFFLRGKLAGADVLPYMLAQFIGAGAAGLLGIYLLMNGSYPPPPPPSEVPDISVFPIVLAELIGTFLLCFVILHVATASTLAGNSFYGLAIGATVTGLIYALGPISGAIFNPAVGSGILAAGFPLWANVLWFLLGQFAGAILAVLFFRLSNGRD